MLNMLQRVLRWFTFIGLTIVVALVVVMQIPFAVLWKVATNPSKATDYFFAVILGCFILYPVLFLLKILILKIQGYRVYLIYGHDEVSVWGLFIQNEWIPFWQFMIDHCNRRHLPDWRYYKKSGGERFPYNVDMGHIRGKTKFLAGRVLAFVYRLLRAVVLLAIFVFAYCSIVCYLAEKI